MSTASTPRTQPPTPRQIYPVSHDPNLGIIAKSESSDHRIHVVRDLLIHNTAELKPSGIAYIEEDSVAPPNTPRRSHISFFCGAAADYRNSLQSMNQSYQDAVDVLTVSDFSLSAADARDQKSKPALAEAREKIRSIEQITEKMQRCISELSLNWRMAQPLKNGTLPQLKEYNQILETMVTISSDGEKLLTEWVNRLSQETQYRNKRMALRALEHNEEIDPHQRKVAKYLQELLDRQKIEKMSRKGNQELNDLRQIVFELFEFTSLAELVMQMPEMAKMSLDSLKAHLYRLHSVQAERIQTELLAEESQREEIARIAREAAVLREQEKKNQRLQVAFEKEKQMSQSEEDTVGRAETKTVSQIRRRVVSAEKMLEEGFRFVGGLETNQAKKDLFSFEAPPIYFHPRVERWNPNSCVSPDEFYQTVRKFPDLAASQEQLRYELMSDEQIKEMSQRHYVPGLDVLLGQPWFQKKYMHTESDHNGQLTSRFLMKDNIGNETSIGLGVIGAHQGIVYHFFFCHEDELFLNSSLSIDANLKNRLKQAQKETGSVLHSTHHKKIDDQAVIHLSSHSDLIVIQSKDPLSGLRRRTLIDPLKT